MDREKSPLMEFLTEVVGTDLLGQGLWGFEREAQRVDSRGDLALTPRPPVGAVDPGLGEVTVDFAESQVELVSAPRTSVQAALAALGELHDLVEARLGEERLWPFSMPPRLPDEALIPLARFDASAEGCPQTAYRQGLADRYGKKMQMISGLHYNFSFPPALVARMHARFAPGHPLAEFRDDLYLAVVRNVLRHRWLLIWLFGASPVADKTYAPVLERELRLVRECCPGARPAVRAADRFALSLRVSRHGYANRRPRRVRYDSLKTYRDDLVGLVASGVLASEAEFYAPVRVKQVPLPGETQGEALDRAGVGYLEVRLLDLDPFERLGIGEAAARFVHLFLLFCLSEPWRPLAPGEEDRADRNHHLAALAGRRSGLRIFDEAGLRVRARDEGRRLLGAIEPLARTLDRGDPRGPYSRALEDQEGKFEAPWRLPSSRILEELARRHGRFADLGLALAGEVSRAR